MSRLFGTDGVRGLANAELTADLALRLAQAASQVLTQGRHADEVRREGRKPLAIVARDPRISGEFLTAAVSAGLASSGIDVLDARVLPTPAAAFLVNDIQADFGVMISASHNHAADNGIKFFSFGGTKLPDNVEERIEKALEGPRLQPTGAGVGRIRLFVDAEDRYLLHLLATMDVSLAGLHIVIDCANGAAAGISPRAFKDAGAQVTVIGSDPDGLNINEGCGSTDLALLQKTVVDVGADLGIAHDGDADRCLAIDASGNVIDGDHIIAILAVSMNNRGLLKSSTVVATVMSNLGLEIALNREGISLRRSAVGDRYVLEDMYSGAYNFGGEQSGHIIFADHSTTGDGLLTGLHLAAEMVRTGKTAAELATVMTALPQILVNVKDVDHANLDSDTEIAALQSELEAELGDSGRILLRSSGTEPLVRVMVEAATQEHAESVATRLADIVRARLSL
jgi:phosphoglucosamine mutase